MEELLKKFNKYCRSRRLCWETDGNRKIEICPFWDGESCLTKKLIEYYDIVKLRMEEIENEN